MPDSFRSVRVDAVVLRHSDYGEADRLLSLYTRQLGKIRAIAKGVRKLTSRKAGHVEPFTYARLQLSKGSGNGLLILTQAETVDAYLPIRDDLVLTAHAAYILELLDRFTYDDETENATLFRLLTDTLSRLASKADPWLVSRYYEIRLLDQLGFRPQLMECANCRRDIKAEDQYFSFTAGGAVCPSCGTGLPSSIPISMDALKYLRHFQRSAYTLALHARPEQKVQAEVETLMQRYFTYLLERDLNTPGFLKRVK